MKIPTTTLIQDNNFASAWARAVRNVIQNGIDLTIGDLNEQKPIKDTCVIFELTGDAITQIENQELHPQFPFRFVDSYCDEFTRTYQKEYRDRSEDEKFTYTYFDRFVDYFGIDQLKMMNRNLAYQIHDEVSSNRNQIITWDPNEDIDHNAAPCLQNLWVRYLGDNQVEVHWHFRSRDLFTAWQANVVALINMLNREVVKPNGCRIVKLVDYSDSLHIYKSDMDEAEKVKLVSKMG